MFRPFRPAAVPAVVAVPEPTPLHERRAAAADRAWLLLATTVPTRDILDAYLDAVLQP